MFDGLDMKGVAINSPTFNWEYVDRLKKATRMKLVLKGIETREDARLCVEHGVDGIMVSNHGGRATETYRATIECLPEVVDGVAGRIPVMVDGGIRRGTDAYKALAFGARAVGHRASLHLGPLGVRATGRGKGDRYSARRVRADHEAVRRPVARRDQPLHRDVRESNFVSSRRTPARPRSQLVVLNVKIENARRREPAASFETGLQQLELIVKEMESGELPLERALELFEKGMQLSESCRKQLEEAETRIEMLIRKGDKIQAEPFRPDKA